MELEIKKAGDDRLYVKYKGKIHIENSGEINKAVKSELKNIKEVVFDFEEVPYISSAGLRMLHDIYKALQEKNGSLYIKNANDDVKNVFEITGFQSFLGIL